MPWIWMNLCVGHQAQQVSWRLGVQLPFFMMPVLRICSSQGLRHELSKGCRWSQNPMWGLLCFGRSLQDDSEICLNDFLIMSEDLHQLWCLGDEGIENIWKPHIETPVMSTLTISKVPSHCMTWGRNHPRLLWSQVACQELGWIHPFFRQDDGIIHSWCEGKILLQESCLTLGRWQKM